MHHMISLVILSVGKLIARHREIFSRNPLFLGMRLPEARELEPLERRFPHLSHAAIDIIKVREGEGEGGRDLNTPLFAVVSPT